MKPKRNFFFVRPKLLLVKLSVVEQSTKIQQTKTATMMTNKKSKSMYSMCMARRDLKVKLLTHFLLFILNIFFRAYESEIVWFGLDICATRRNWPTLDVTVKKQQRQMSNANKRIFTVIFHAFFLHFVRAVCWYFTHVSCVVVLWVFVFHRARTHQMIHKKMLKNVRIDFWCSLTKSVSFCRFREFKWEK